MVHRLAGVHWVAILSHVDCVAAREHSSCVAYVVPMPINHPDMCKVYAMDDWSDKLCAGKKNARQGVCGVRGNVLREQIFQAMVFIFTRICQMRKLM